MNWLDSSRRSRASQAMRMAASPEIVMVAWISICAILGHTSDFRLSTSALLSYRHLFHAGNFADVFKHALLARLLIALGGKDRPYFFLDTHAGTGRYDLSHEWAWKAREFENGITRLWERQDIPGALAPYMDIVRAENPKGRLRYYPGSPLIALKLRSARDRLVFTELNKDDC